MATPARDPERAVPLFSRQLELVEVQDQWVASWHFSSGLKVGIRPSQLCMLWKARAWKTKTIWTKNCFLPSKCYKFAKDCCQCDDRVFLFDSRWCQIISGPECTPKSTKTSVKTTDGGVPTWSRKTFGSSTRSFKPAKEVSQAGKSYEPSDQIYPIGQAQRAAGSTVLYEPYTPSYQLFSLSRFVPAFPDWLCCSATCVVWCVLFSCEWACVNALCIMALNVFCFPSPVCCRSTFSSVAEARDRCSCFFLVVCVRTLAWTVNYTSQCRSTNRLLPRRKPVRYKLSEPKKKTKKKLRGKEYLKDKKKTEEKNWKDWRERRRRKRKKIQAEIYKDNIKLKWYGHQYDCSHFYHNGRMTSLWRNLWRAVILSPSRQGLDEYPLPAYQR